MRFRKRPIIIEAERFAWPSGRPVRGGDSPDVFMTYVVQRDERGAHLIIPTLEGDFRADVGDWIVTGITGEQYPVKDSIFRVTYEPVDDDREEA